MQEIKNRLNLRLFDGEGGAPAAEGVEAGSGEATAKPSDAGKGRRANPLADVVYGKQTESDPPDTAQGEEADRDAAGKENAGEQTANKTPDRKAEFEKLIKGEYKDLFAKRTQEIIDSRFKETKLLESRLTEAEPIFDMLSKKYGVDGSDLKKLASAIEEDDSYYEEEALNRGLSVEQLKSMKKLERDNESMRRALEDQQRRENAERVYAGWVKQAEDVKTIYPAFDLQEECRNDQFVSLLQNNVDVRTAYEVIHRDEILGGAMQYTAEQVSKKIVDGIRSKNARPTENGIAAGGAAVAKPNVKSWSNADRDEVERRVLRGEKIIL